jgi:hypothetical protein
VKSTLGLRTAVNRNHHPRGAATNYQHPSLGRRTCPGEPARLRHVAFQVNDLRSIVDRVRDGGWGTIGEIVNFENMLLLC